ncbi:MAG: flavodoxin family protein [Deltaproteobacteria bacterium]|jgi:multimeric flavodoxin WrbA|nr:flavodoxin family protein [Deltaproteobacteria bacterium]
MKIALILGSPRATSNSAKIAEKAVSALPGGDKEVRKFVINQLGARGCQGCDSCKKKTETCVVKDEMNQVLVACQESDVLVVASPVYIGEISAQLKLFVDRSYAWYKPDFITNPNPSRLPAGKKLLFILTQGNPDPDCYRSGITEKYVNYFSSHGLKCASLAAVIPHDPALVEEALEKHYREVSRIAASL